jgi:serine/threonine protein kinase
MSSEASRVSPVAPSALPAGTRLGEFELKSLLGVGGFGIVYLAFDHALEREVAVKEYMPASLAGRTETMHVSLRSQSDAETFALGLKSFVNEARLLARFDHPSLLKVLRFWEANGTAYMAMPVMRGRTLKEVRLAMRQAPDEAWLRALVEPLLGAIEKLHSEGVYHRDIAPDNIQIEPDGHPVLLDFGAARRVLSDKSQTLTAILKPAYAPIEQYAEAGSVKQGPWTDIYALGATLHFVLLGRPPAPATTRAVHDEPSALTVRNLPGCSKNFLHAIDWMLAPRPLDRPQSVAALREVLAGDALPPRPRQSEASGSQWDRTVVLNPRTVAPTEPGPGARTATAPAAADTTARRAPTQTLSPPAAVSPAQAQAPAPAGAASGSKALPVALGLAVLLAAAAAAVFWPRQAAAPAVAGAASAAVVAAPVASAAAAAPVPESAIATVAVPDAAPAAAVEAPKAVSTAARPAAEKPAVALRRTAPLAVAPVVVVAPAPVPAAPAGEAPKPHAEAPAPVPVAEAPKPVPVGPEAKCEGLNPFKYFICMESACLRAEFSTHADCQKWRQGARHE